MSSRASSSQASGQESPITRPGSSSTTNSINYMGQQCSSRGCAKTTLTGSSLCSICTCHKEHTDRDKGNGSSPVKSPASFITSVTASPVRNEFASKTTNHITRRSTSASTAAPVTYGDQRTDKEPSIGWPAKAPSSHANATLNPQNTKVLNAKATARKTAKALPSSSSFVPLESITVAQPGTSYGSSTKATGSAALPTQPPMKKQRLSADPHGSRTKPINGQPVTNGSGLRAEPGFALRQGQKPDKQLKTPSLKQDSTPAETESARQGDSTQMLGAAAGHVRGPTLIDLSREDDENGSEGRPPSHSPESASNRYTGSVGLQNNAPIRPVNSSQKSMNGERPTYTSSPSVERGRDPVDRLKNHTHGDVAGNGRNIANGALGSSSRSHPVESQRDSNTKAMTSHRGTRSPSQPNKALQSARAPAQVYQRFNLSPPPTSRPPSSSVKGNRSGVGVTGSLNGEITEQGQPGQARSKPGPVANGVQADTLVEPEPSRPASTWSSGSKDMAPLESSATLPDVRQGSQARRIIPRVPKAVMNKWYLATMEASTTGSNSKSVEHGAGDQPRDASKPAGPEATKGSTLAQLFRSSDTTNRARSGPLTLQPQESISEVRRRTSTSQPRRGLGIGNKKAGSVSTDLATPLIPLRERRRQALREPGWKTLTPQQRQQLLIDTHDEALFDKAIYGPLNEARRSGTALYDLPHHLQPQHDVRPSRYFAHFDPRVHWTNARTEDWYDRKQDEISARGSRKSRIHFAKPAERRARLKAEEAERGGPPRTELPERVRSNPAWMAAVAEMDEMAADYHREKRQQNKERLRVEAELRKKVKDKEKEMIDANGDDDQGDVEMVDA
ncbi:uncharacterized protein BCR38DRAFT_406853 [Pseudomassariella vexata]|uniref:Uncharacterized protein n=1 Tax=Pseudomassariella vexata TaxID=1141098 RepID=A0A1Y2EC46_9PEZI|nr:uncharacterized protein BCR38DRAFT_406853 [Pseudomassariella vexata]ORY68977.1 hypothetical protein BCR38DRAFT_406853 [Pseudomassariella vexata]